MSVLGRLKEVGIGYLSLGQPLSTLSGGELYVIEHNLDVICQADWMIDLGPGAGADGGRVLYEGIPKQIVECGTSITGQYVIKT